MSPSRLYAKCKKQRVPFHQWYRWIESELKKVNELQKRAMEAQRQPLGIIDKIQRAIFSTRSGR